MTREAPYEIYAITSMDFWYIGSASGNVVASDRWQRHISGRGGALKLYEAICAYGKDAFSQEVLEVGHGDVIAAEQSWYDEYSKTDLRVSLNARRPFGWAGRDPGFTMTDDHKEKLRRVNQGVPNSPETRAKISAALTGKTKSPEHVAKVAAANRGRIVTQEFREQMSRLHKGSVKGPMSDATKAKIGEKNSVKTAECECGLVSTGAGVASHCKATGHERKLPDK